MSNILKNYFRVLEVISSLYCKLENKMDVGRKQKMFEIDVLLNINGLMELGLHFLNSITLIIINILGRFVLGLPSEIQIISPQAFKDYISEKQSIKFS